MPRKRAVNGSGMQPRLRKDNLWEMRVVIGRNPQTGKLMRKSVYAKTSAECSRKSRELSVSVDKGTYKEPCKLTLGEWLDIWLSEYTGAIKESTRHVYSDNVKNHIRPGLGANKLSKLSPHAVQTFINDLQRGSRPLSAKMVVNIHGVLSKALAEAERVGYINSNPASKCILPKRAKRDINPLETKDIIRFVEAIKGNPSEHIFFVALYTGMRLSELLGLRWSRIDFGKGIITVDSQLLLKRGQGTERKLGTPKNGLTRSFVAAPAVLDHLCIVQTQQDIWQAKAGEVWDNSLDLVFTDEVGHPIPHATVEHRFTTIMDSLGLTGYRFHDLRHTFATQALYGGMNPKTVSDTLGHASVAFTLDIYASVTHEMQNVAAAQIQNLILSHQNQG